MNSDPSIGATDAPPSDSSLPMLHWHPQWFVFVFTLALCIATYLGLVFINIESKAKDDLADLLLAMAGVGGSALGLWGESRDPKGRTFFTKFSWAGYMIFTTLIFGFAVGIYQKFWIDPRCSAQDTHDADKKHEELLKKMEVTAADLKSAEKRASDEATKRTQHEATANANAVAASTKLEEVRTAAAACPGLKTPLDELEKFVKKDLSPGTRAALAAELKPFLDQLALSRDLTALRGDVSKLSVDMGAVARATKTNPLRLWDPLLTEHRWVGDWAKGGWRTEAQFTRGDDQKLTFAATTRIQSAARPWHDEFDILAMEWKGEPFTAIDGEEAISFTTTRTVLDGIKFVEPNQTPRAYRSVATFRLGLVLLGTYGKDSNGREAKLILHAQAPTSNTDE